MKRRTLALIGCAVTVAIMAVMAYSVYLYSQDPDATVYMAAMSMSSGGLMVFLVLFGLLYSRSGGSPSEMYDEIYRGVCSRCGTAFENGVCPGCGRRQPKGRWRPLLN